MVTSLRVLPEVATQPAQPEVDREMVSRYLGMSRSLYAEVSIDGELRMVTPALADALGYEAEALLGSSWFDHLTDEGRAEERGRFAHMLRAPELCGAAREIQLRAATGETVEIGFVLRPLSEPGRGLIGGLYIGQGHRCCQLRQTEQALEAYRYALHASEIVSWTDRSGRITHVNEPFLSISGYTAEELVGHDHRLLNSGHHGPEFFEQLWATIRAGQVWRGDIKNRAKDGSFYWVATTIVPFFDGDLRPQRYISIRHEITERKEVESTLERTVADLASAREEESRRSKALTEAKEHLTTANRRIREEQAKLIQAEKLSSIGMLASGVAHEINNPLAGVMNCVRALSRGQMADNRREDYFRTAQEGLERIQQIVRGLLDYARQRPVERSEIDVAEVLSSCQRLIQPYFRHRDAALLSELEPEQVILRADRAQLMQALINLLLNAIYVTPKGEAVEFSVRKEPGRVGLCVRDHGPGMEHELIHRVCDPFYSTKPEGEGTGLGLAVTLSIARAHGGDLEFDCGAEQGTSVILWLPTEGGPRA